MTMENGKNYYNIRPVVIVTIGFLLGIISAYLLIIDKRILALVLLILSIALFLTWYCVSVLKNRRKGIVAIISIIFVVLGFVYAFSRNSTKSELPYGSEVYFSGKVVEIKSESYYDGRYEYELVVKGEANEVKGIKAKTSLSTKGRIYCGQALSFKGNIYKRKVDKFSLSTGVKYIIEDTASVIVGDINDPFAKLKRRLLISLENTMPISYATNYALLTGDTQYISEELLVKYRETGIAHVFAVSGLHIGLLYGILTGLMKLLRVKPKLKVILTISLLLLYVAFCGFSASSMRAFIIISVYMIASVLGLKADSSSSTFLSAFIILVINPFDVLSVGFILSFSVCLGLIVMTKPFANILGKVLPLKMAKWVSPYIVAHLVSFPVLLDAFSSVQPLSFALNMLFIPLIGFFYTFSFIGAVLILIFPNASFFSVVPELYLSAINRVLTVTDTSTFLIKDFEVLYAMPFYYSYLYLLCGKINFKLKTLRILRIIFLLATILVTTLINTLI